MAGLSDLAPACLATPDIHVMGNLSSEEILPLVPGRAGGRAGAWPGR